MSIKEDGKRIIRIIKRIIRIIKRIKSDRNRACYQNILAFARREDKDLDTECVKETINNLVERNIITNINKDKPGMESFNLNENLETEMLINKLEGDENCQSLDHYINDRVF